MKQCDECGWVLAGMISRLTRLQALTDRLLPWLKLKDVRFCGLDQATIQERMDAGKVTTTQEAALASATEMGYGAVKYFDLRQHPTTSYVFR